MTESPLRFRCGDLELEGRVAIPGGATRACVICHPHPLYGGDMNNPVVVAIARALGEAGVATLRFNFRGVGASQGSHGGGTAEIDDARAALDALAERSGLAHIAIAGYSFGAVVALKLAASDPRTLAVAVVAPPVEMVDSTFVRSIAAPLLAIAGDRDACCPTSGLEAMTAGLAGAATVTLAGADHFLGGREREVSGAVARFVAAA